MPEGTGAKGVSSGCAPHHLERSVEMRIRNRVMLGVVGGLAVAGLLLSTGCATRNFRKDEAGQMITQGQKSVLEAEGANATATARAELEEARGKLSEAQKAYDQTLYDQAGRLAEEGAAAADYARAKAVSEKSRTDAEEVRRHLETLLRQIEQQSPSK